MQSKLRKLRYRLKGRLQDFSLLLRYALHWVHLAKEVRCYNRQKKSPPVVLCVANPGSVGGTELQIQIIAEELKNRFGDCLVLISGRLEGERSNLFLKSLKSLDIPTLQLGIIGLIPYSQWPFLGQKTANLLGTAIGNSKICHFFSPGSTVLVPVIKNIGLAIYYMETGMPVSEGPWKILHNKMDQFDYVTSVSLAGLRRLEFLYEYKGPACVTHSMFNLPKGSFICRKPSEGLFDIVYFGRMTRNKGIDLLIGAFSRVVRAFPYATLSLIGSGERLSQYQNLVRESGLSERVRFTSWLQGEALFSRLSASDLFCLPSYSEGLPCSILEAMSIGLPIVATDVGGISEIIEQGVSGILIPPRDEIVLTKALLEIAADPVRRAQLREEAFLRWKRVGTKEIIMTQLMSAYGMLSC